MELKLDRDTTWNLTDMFADDAAWEVQMAQVGQLGEKLAARKGSAAGSAAALLETLRRNDELGLLGAQCAIYAECRFHTDMAAAKGKEMVGRLEILFTRIGEQTAFLEPELMRCGRENFDRFCAEEPALEGYRRMMEDLFDRGDHLLDDAGEAMLTRMSDLGGVYRQVFEDLVINDTPVPTVEGPDGSPVRVTEAGYSAALQSGGPCIPREVLQHPAGAVRQPYQHPRLQLLRQGQGGRLCRKEPPLSLGAGRGAGGEPHSGGGLRPADLDGAGQHRPAAGVCRAALPAARNRGFPFYDFFVPLAQEVCRAYPYEEAARLVMEATAPLGEDYAEKMRAALENRWIDVYPKDNKQTGAYSTGTYGFHPYMLLNYDNTLEDVFTLVHELGHSMHTIYSCESQPFVYSDYSIFCAEVASTVNEQLLHHYLLAHCESPALRRLLLAKHLDDLRSTFYRQTMLADFEMQTHAKVEAGEPLLPDVLCGIHAQLNRDYYGPQLVVDDTLSYEWARIPHFYRHFYVYQYATGISAAIAIANRILSGVPGAVEDYKKFLSGGSSQHPIELLRLAGVDMASPQPVLDTVAEFSETLDELKKLL